MIYQVCGIFIAIGEREDGMAFLTREAWERIEHLPEDTLLVVLRVLLEFEATLA